MTRSLQPVLCRPWAMPPTLASSASNRSRSSRPPGAPALQQVDLHEVHRVDVGIAQLDRALQRRIGIEQLAAVLDGEHLLARQPRTRRADVAAEAAQRLGRERVVVLRDLQIGARQHRLDVVDEVAQEEPAGAMPRAAAAGRSCSTTARKPAPAPYQPGSMWRDCDQANTHGTGSRPAMPGLSARCTERAPICMRSITSIGVTRRK